MGGPGYKLADEFHPFPKLPSPEDVHGQFRSSIGSAAVLHHRCSRSRTSITCITISEQSVKPGRGQQYFRRTGATAATPQYPLPSSVKIDRNCRSTLFRTLALQLEQLTFDLFHAAYARQNAGVFRSIPFLFARGLFICSIDATLSLNRSRINWLLLSNRLLLWSPCLYRRDKYGRARKTSRAYFRCFCSRAVMLGHLARLPFPGSARCSRSRAGFCSCGGLRFRVSV